MSTQQFRNLPTELIQHIFSRIPIQDLLLVRGVSRVWLANHQLACQSRKTLILQFRGSPNETNSPPTPIDIIRRSNFEGNFFCHHIDQDGNQIKYSISENKRNQIYISYFPIEASQFLAETFSCLRTLIVANYQIEPKHFESLICLLNGFASTLVKLKLYLINNSKECNTIMKHIISNERGKLINQLNSLTALKFVTFESLFAYMEPSSIERPEFLTRVHEFYCDFVVGPKSWFEWLQEYESTERMTKLKRIAVNGQYEASEYDQWPVSASFTRLSDPMIILGWFKIKDSSLYRKFLLNFSSLRAIKMNDFCFRYNHTQICHILSPLTKLVQVHLRITQEMYTEKIDLCSTAQLYSVKALDMHVNRLRDYEPQISALLHMFPNLHSIVVHNYERQGFDFEQYRIEDVAMKFCMTIKRTYDNRPKLRIKYRNTWVRNVRFDL